MVWKCNSIKGTRHCTKVFDSLENYKSRIALEFTATITQRTMQLVAFANHNWVKAERHKLIPCLSVIKENIRCGKVPLMLQVKIACVLNNSPFTLLCRTPSDSMKSVMVICSDWSSDKNRRCPKLILQGLKDFKTP